MNPFDEHLTEALEGNTKVDSSNASSRKTKLDCLYKYWCGTHHLQFDKFDVDFLNFIQKQTKFIYGCETCPTTGKRHYQFFFQSNVKSGVRKSALIKAHPKTHFENCISNYEANYAYCAKLGNFHTNIFDIYIPDITPDIMYPWQKKCLQLALSIPDKRTIHWFWDHKGNTGKTSMAKYLSHYHSAIPLRGKTNDILHCATEHVSLLYIFISPRSLEEYFPYEGLELIKDGYFMSGKYESKPVIRPNPNVFVFANFEPNMLKCSNDRWNIIDVSEL